MRQELLIDDIDKHMRLNKFGFMQTASKVGGKLYAGTHTACHSCLGDIEAGVTDLYTSKWVRNATPGVSHYTPIPVDAERFFSFVLDKERSPWRSILKDVRVEKDYVHFTNLDIPGQVVANLCILLRMPAELPARILLFNRFVSLGCSDLDALYLIAHYNPRITNKGVEDCLPSMTGGGHFPFNDTNTISYSRLWDGNPLVTKGSFKENPRNNRHPTNAIWNGGQNLHILAGGYSGSFSCLWKRISVVKTQPEALTPEQIVERFNKIKDKLK